MLIQHRSNINSCRDFNCSLENGWSAEECYFDNLLQRLPSKEKRIINLMYSQTVRLNKNVQSRISTQFHWFNLIIWPTCSDTTFSSKSSAFFLHSAVCFWCFSSSAEYIAFSSNVLKIQNKINLDSQHVTLFWDT